jgi:hypothetical protein
MSSLSKETLDLYRKSVANPIYDNDALGKAAGFTQAASAVSGLTSYDLDPQLGHLYPVLTPLRDMIPRSVGGKGIQANWRAITGTNTAFSGAGVSEGNRGAAITHTTKDYVAAFKGIGLDDFVTFEQDMTSEGFVDSKAEAVLGLLNAVMIAEENIILGANNSVALGTTGTPSVSTSTTGGTLAAATYSIICVALTLDGFLTAGGPTAGVTNGLPLSAARTTSDGTSEAYNQGTAIKSAAASQVTTGSTSTISATTAIKANAYAYAWFWGTAGNELLGAITTINSVLITANATGTQNASAGFTADKSQNSLVFDGLLTQIMTSGSGSYFYQMPAGVAGTGTPLTSNNDGTIVEIDAALQSFWDNYRLSPDKMWVSSQEMKNIRKKALTGTTTSAQRFVFDTNQRGIIVGNGVKAYTNPFAMGGNTDLEILLHPTLPAGTILFTSSRLPYKLPNVSVPLRMRLRRDYYELDYPQIKRKFEYGVYFDGVLQNYFPPAFGMITNIGNG